MLEPGTLLQQGRYQILRPIKAGGMGAVYEARATHLKCTVAVKQSLVSDDDEMRHAFEREAHLLANLRHRSLPRVIDHFVEDDGHYLVMDFIPGDDLATLMQQRGREPFPTDQVLRWADDLLCALDYLHTRQPSIIHRDIKPLNIKLTDDDQIVLLDFGLAKGRVPQASHSSGKKSLQGFTPHYAPVEQITGKGTDARSDIYSLAATLYHLVTGKAPPDAMARAGEILSGDPDPLVPANEINPDVLPDFAELLKQSMSYNRDHRPASAALVRKKLKDIANAHDRPTETDLTEKVDIYKTRKTDEIPTIIRPALNVFHFDTVTLNEQGEPADFRKVEAMRFTEDLGHCISLEMVQIPAGEFVMGSAPNEIGRRPNEGPQRPVTVPSFYIGKFQVTQAQWRSVAELPAIKMDLLPDPSNFKNDSLPVDAVFWEEAIEFCARLTHKTGKRYRLPSEAEWEYAARAGTKTPFAFGPTIVSDLVNFNGGYPYGGGPKSDYRQKTTTVGGLGVANAFGLFDMHGNVWEWCQDIYHDNYSGAPFTSSAWETGGTGERVLRGGSWYCESRLCRAAFRLNNPPGSRYNAVGFRVAI